jgi:hypothetical protein
MPIQNPVKIARKQPGLLGRTTELDANNRIPSARGVILSSLDTRSILLPAAVPRS